MTHGGQTVWLPCGYPFSSFPCPDCDGRARYHVVKDGGGWVKHIDDDGNVLAMLGEHAVKS